MSVEMGDRSHLGYGESKRYWDEVLRNATDNGTMDKASELIVAKVEEMEKKIERLTELVNELLEKTKEKK